MRIAGLSVVVLMLTGGTLLAQAPGQVVSLTAADGKPLRWQFEVGFGDESASDRWEAFLGALLAHFDRDGNVRLEAEEVGRMMPLSRANGDLLTMNFSLLDADRSGAVSRAELHAYCQNNGFRPVTIVVEAPSPDDQRLANRFLAWLDKNNKGRLDAKDWQAAAATMSRYDLNEDGYLDRDELLNDTPNLADAAARSGSVSVGAGTPEVLLEINLDAQQPNIVVRQDKKGRVAAIPTLADSGCRRYRDVAGGWTLTIEPRCERPDVASAGDFLIAQLQAATGGEAGMSLDDIADDPALGAFRELAPWADRNGDERLRPEELKKYVELVAAALAAQVWVTLVDHAENPFPLLDGDRDDRLSYRELATAGSVLFPATATGSDVRHFELRFGSAPIRSWGGMFIPAIRDRRQPSVPVSEAPAWFAALDANGDFIVSPLEFLGPPDLFRRLDADRNGMLTPEEAESAGAARR